MAGSSRVLRGGRSPLALVLTTTLLLTGASALAPPGPRAAADTRPVDQGEPVTVSADPLPTVQVDGVVWSQVVVGRTVYAAGSFSTARPAGAAPGTSTVARANLLAYDLVTGQLVTTWAPTTNAQVHAITASPDGSRIYVGGDFTRVNGATVWRVAALHPTTGALLTSFLPRPDYRVKAMVATASTVYLGGGFTHVGSSARNRLAAVRASDGALLSWAPNANGAVHALALSPDGARLVVGGAFTTLNGSSRPGYGLGAVSTSTGANLPFAANDLIRNGGTNGAITSLSGDGELVFGTGYTVGRAGGTLEGTFAARWDGTFHWVEDCHGDTYSAVPVGDLVYQASHKHYCGNIDGFPQTVPWPYQHGTVVTRDVRGTATREQFGYTNYEGQPVPAMLNWFPGFTIGTYTGQNQGPWHVTTAQGYVLMGGEFRAVAGVPQQGLVRFAPPSVAPNDVGPQLSGGKIDLEAHSTAAGTVRVRWTANHDPDNRQLTYLLVHNSNTANPVNVQQGLSMWFDRRPMGFVHTGLAPGSTQRYRLFVRDPWGNEARSDTVTVTVSGTTPPANAYAAAVARDGAVSHWRFEESSGTRARDAVGWDDLDVLGSVTRGVAGPPGTGNAYGFNGTNAQFATTRTHQRGPHQLSLEAWFRTSSTRGGKIIGLGDAATSVGSIMLDRHVYLDANGTLVFGVRPAGTQIIRSPRSYTDGQWHHVVATLSGAGMRLYVDGALVASRADVTRGAPIRGHWRVAGDTLTGWSNRPASDYLSGQVDEVAVYERALTAAQVAEHHALGRGQAAPDPEPEPSVLARDAFGRQVSGGWGSADLGGAWSVGGSASRYSVSGGTGRMTLAPGAGTAAYLPVSSASTDVSASIAVDRLPGGSGLYASLTPRRTASGVEYRAKVRVAADGAVTLQHVRVVGGAETTLGTTAVPGLVVTPGPALVVRTQAVGSSPTTLRSTVHAAGSADPGWLLVGTDSTSGLQAAGGVGVVGYLSSGSGVAVTLGVDDVLVRTAAG